MEDSIISYLFTAVIILGIGGYVVLSTRKNQQKMQKAVSEWEEKEARAAQGLPDESDGSYFSSFSREYEKLDKYKEIPHVVDEIFYKMYEKPPTFGKEKWLAEAANLPVIYGAVVQASSTLYEEPKNNEDDRGGMVLVAAESLSHRCDGAWIQQIAQRVQKVRDSAQIPEDAKKIVKLLRDTESGFCEILPTSLTDGEKVWCWTEGVYPSQLPKGKIPTHRVLPFVMKNPEVNMGGFYLIQAEVYS